MKIPSLLQLLVVFLLTNLFLYCKEGTNSIEQEIISTDIANFYDAFDAIQKTNDTTTQLKLLHELFLDKATPGQEAMIAARNYSPNEYVEVMTSFPKFWNSLQENTTDLSSYNDAIIHGVGKLKTLYPELTPSTIYYTMGAFRSPGTGFDDKVLLGTEFALGPKTVDVSEFKGVRDHTAKYYKIDPPKYLSFLTVHEYVHTQQKEIPDNLLSHTLREGFAEFIAILATGQASPWEAFTYGPENDMFVRDTFEAQLFNGRSFGNWLWNSNDNVFGHHDMAYYVGYTIAARYYEQAEDPLQAVKDIIELDFMDEQAVENFVASTGYFTQSLTELYERYKKNRPFVVGIEPFENGDQAVDPSITEVTVHFSKPMDTLYRGFDFGPLGEENAMKLSQYLGFSLDRKSIRFKVNLTPNKRYQLQLPSKFLDSMHNAIPPYLIDFKTKE